MLHLGCLGMARGGLYMMKYTLCHPEHFTHPHIAFFMGLVQFTNLWFAEIINTMKATNRKTPGDLIASYVGFKIIQDLPTMYMGGVTSPVKGTIGKVTATMGRKVSNEHMPYKGLFNVVYVLNKWFFNSVYFYFFTFVSIFIPLSKLLVERAAI